MRYQLGLCCFIIMSSHAQAFTLIGGSSEVKGWSSQNLEFHVNQENCPDETSGLLDEALDLWNAVPTAGLRISRGDATDQSLETALAGLANVSPSVHCVLNMSALGLNPEVIPGVATGQKLNPAGRLEYGVLLLNVEEGTSANINNLGRAKLVSVIAHEIGHILGLGHSSDTAALMYYDVSLKETASLSQDDADGLTYLYPRNELEADALLGGCGVVSGGSPAAGSAGLLWLTILPGLLVIRLLKDPK
jgi:hypothetical protein